MSATPVIEPLGPVQRRRESLRIISTQQAHDALANFEDNLGKNLTTLRDETAVRNVGLRKQHGSINLTVRSNLEAVFVQLTGNRAVASDCQPCQNGTGPFISCVQHSKIGDGSCANCLYKRQGSSCTHQLSTETDSDDIPLSRLGQHRKRQTDLAAPSPKKTIEKRRRTIGTGSITHLEAPFPLPAHQQLLQPLQGPTPAPTPPAVTSHTQVGGPPVHGPGTVLGSATDHWLNSLAFSKYASPAPTQGHMGSTDFGMPISGHPLENNTNGLPQAPMANIHGLPQASAAVRDNRYAPSPAPFQGNVNDNLDHDTTNLILAYLPRNVSPDVLRSIAQYHQDLADDLRMEAKRLEKEMRQERECEWGAQAARQVRYE